MTSRKDIDSNRGSRLLENNENNDVFGSIGCRCVHCVVALNFSDQSEAAHFHQMIDEKLLAKQQRKTERRQTVASRQVNRPPPLPVASNDDSNNVLQPIIYDFGESHGGIEKTTQELEKERDAPFKLSGPPPPPPQRSAPGPPPPPSRGAPPRGPASPPPQSGSSRAPSRSWPPPPPSLHSFRGLPPPPSRVGPPPPPQSSAPRAPPSSQSGYNERRQTVASRQVNRPPPLPVASNDDSNNVLQPIIYDFGESHGGIEKTTQELEKERDAPFKLSGPPPPPPQRSAPGPPPPPSRGAPPRGPAPPPPQSGSSRAPSRSWPPPPPSLHSFRGLPPPPSRVGPPPPPQSSAPRAPPSSQSGYNERRQTVASRQVNRPLPPPVASNDHSNNVLQPINSTSTPSTISPSTSSNGLKKNKKNKGGKKQKLTKGDICTPSDFRHVGHVGWDPRGGFDVNNIDPQWKKHFDTIGVTQTQLEDAETSKFIYDFVESHGGIEKATQELEKERDASERRQTVASRQVNRPPPLPVASNDDSNNVLQPIIYDFGESHGGIEKTTQELEKERDAPFKLSGPPPPPPQRSAPGPPPPPSRGAPPCGPAPPSPQSGSSRAPSRSWPPPPPSLHSFRGLPPPPSRVGPPPPPQSTAPRAPPSSQSGYNERRQTVTSRQVNRPLPPPVASNDHSNNVLQPINSTSTPSTISPSTSSNGLKKNKKNKGGKKQKLTKGDICTPSDFRHVGHVGWDPRGGFDVNNIDPQWKKHFDTIGVTQTQLEDAETSKFIYDFVESHGGIEKATQELEKERDASGPPTPPPQRSAPGPPPPPSRGAPPCGPAPPSPQSGSSRAPSRSWPPPPPSLHSFRGLPPPPSRVGPPPPPQSTAPRAPPSSQSGYNERRQTVASRQVNRPLPPPVASNDHSNNVLQPIIYDFGESHGGIEKATQELEEERDASVAKDNKSSNEMYICCDEADFPSYWSKVSASTQKLIPVPNDVRSKIERHFTEKMGMAQILSVEELVNKELYAPYAIKKKLMEKRFQTVNEKQLWHGTKTAVVNEIIVQNFDWRLYRTGVLYGNGSYFAKDSSYSHSYTSPDPSGVRSMFYADVLVGEYAQGSSGMPRPPVKSGQVLYDSCVDNTANPTIFVIFSLEQCYPRYLLKYK